MGYLPVCHVKGKAFDTAVMESFFGALKDECVRNTIYASRDEAR